MNVVVIAVERRVMSLCSVVNFCVVLGAHWF
jgi:hypothetical protein